MMLLLLNYFRLVDGLLTFLVVFPSIAILLHMESSELLNPVDRLSDGSIDPSPLHIAVIAAAEVGRDAHNPLAA